MRNAGASIRTPDWRRHERKIASPRHPWVRRAAVRRVRCGGSTVTTAADRPANARPASRTPSIRRLPFSIPISPRHRPCRRLRLDCRGSRHPPRGLRATGYGLRATGYGLRAAGYGLRNRTRNACPPSTAAWRSWRTADARHARIPAIFLEDQTAQRPDLSITNPTSPSSDAQAGARSGMSRPSTPTRPYVRDRRIATGFISRHHVPDRAAGSSTTHGTVPLAESLADTSGVRALDDAIGTPARRLRMTPAYACRTEWMRWGTRLVELSGIEPLASAVRLQRSPI